MAAMAVVFSVMVLNDIRGLHGVSRDEAVRRLNDVVNCLFWPAAWVGLRQFSRKSILSRLRFVPMAIYGLGSIFTETRLNLVMILAFLALLSYVRHRRGVAQSLSWILTLFLAVWLGLFSAIFLTNTRSFEAIADAATAFSSRATDDTRTDQLRTFAESVAPQELLLGRGSLATWNWHNLVWTGGTDVGYLSLLFYGGLPLLITYAAVHLQPGFRVLRTTTSDVQLAGAAVVVLWAVRMCSSSFPGLSLDYYPILFCVGACISRPEPIWRTARWDLSSEVRPGVAVR
jgi:hypothetical protein